MMPAQRSSVVDFVDIAWDGRLVSIEHQWLRRDATDAPLVVFLHEGLGSVAMWRDFPLQLCETLGCRGLVYSRPGYGRSSPRSTTERWHPDFMHRQAREVLPALLNALGVDCARDKLWLLGHSDGGSIALLFAASFPSHLCGAVVIAPHIFVEDISLHSISKARTAYLEADLRQRLSRYHADPDSAFWGWCDAWLSPEFRSWRIDQEMHAISCALLAIQGEGDEYGTLNQIRGIARGAPHCQLIELANCGHSPHRDKPTELLDAIRHFFEASSST